MKKIILSCVLALFIPLTGYAAEVTINLDPKIPEPYSTVTLSLISYDVDVDTSMVIWKVNNKETKRGLGEKQLTLALGAVGTAVPVTATVSDSLGNTVVASIAVSPQSLTLLWEAVESYVPPFYEGKALPAEGAKIKVVAIPSMGFLASSLSYGWYVEDSILESSSGAGKQSALVTLDALTSETSIRARVRSPSGAVAEKTLSITPHEILPTLYEYDELLGTNLTKPILRRMELSGDRILSLEPYYLSARGVAGNTATYDWYLDGLPVTPLEKSLLALHPKENAYGTRTLKVVVTNSKRLFQEAQAEVQVLFDTRNR